LSIVVVPLTDSADPIEINMEATDTLQFVAEVSGVFTSTYSKYFCPHLPHNKSLGLNETWPNTTSYPEGTEPNPYAAGKIYTFNWTPDSEKQGGLTSSPGTIHVDSGTTGEIVA
jgi:hypothetical protein